MTHIISVINQKGGVGKTTTAAAIAAGLRIFGGRSVLSIDMDSQANLSLITGAEADGATILDVLAGGSEAAEAIQHTPNGDIIIGDRYLAQAETHITGAGREYVLRRALEGVKDNYDFIVIDTPPALGVLSLAALTASTAAVIPAQADLLSLDAIEQLNDTIRAVREGTENTQLKIAGIVLTRWNGRRIIAQNAADSIKDTAAAIGTHVFNAKIRECAAIQEAQAMRRNIFSYAPRSNAAKDYKELTEEAFGNEQEG